MTQPEHSIVIPPKVDVRLIDEPKPITFPALFTQAIAPVLALGGAISVLLLSLGWSYAWHWFAEWKVPFASLGLGPDILFEYGRFVAWHFWWLVLLWLAAMSTMAWLSQLYQLGKTALTVLFVVSILVPWLGSHNLAGRAAASEVQRQHEEKFSTWMEIQVILRPEYAGVVPNSILASLSIGPDLCHRLMFRATNGLWVVRMNHAGRPGATVFLPNEAIAYLRLRQASGGDC